MAGPPNAVCSLHFSHHALCFYVCIVVLFTLHATFTVLVKVKMYYSSNAISQRRTGLTLTYGSIWRCLKCLTANSMTRGTCVVGRPFDKYSCKQFAILKLSFDIKFSIPFPSAAIPHSTECTTLTQTPPSWSRLRMGPTVSRQIPVPRSETVLMGRPTFLHTCSMMRD